MPTLEERNVVITFQTFVRVILWQCVRLKETRKYTFGFMAYINIFLIMLGLINEIQFSKNKKTIECTRSKKNTECRENRTSKLLQLEKREKYKTNEKV